MKYYICLECKQKYTGWAKDKFCPKCKREMKEITQEEFYPNERIEEIEDDIADLKLQNKVNEYKERYPTRFKV